MALKPLPSEYSLTSILDVNRVVVDEDTAKVILEEAGLSFFTYRDGRIYGYDPDGIKIKGCYLLGEPVVEEETP